MAPSGSVALTYKPTDELSIYSKYSRGWKPGVFNAAVLLNQNVGGDVFRPEIKLTDPEFLDAFEIGMNASWFDGAIEMRSALFYYKYSDYQVFIFRNSFGAPPQFEIVNANDAQIYGAEIDLYLEPLRDRVPQAMERLILEARFSWLESEFLDFTDTNTTFAGVNFVTQEIDFSGNQLPNAPRFKLSTSARWTFELGRFGSLTPRYDLTYTADVHFDPSEGRGLPRPELSPAPELPKYSIAQKAYVLHDLRLSYLTPGGQIELAGWVRNLTDETYKTYTAEATGIDSLLNWIGDPRTFGASISVNW
jgi:iron complex outermembrane receptor protein